MFIQPSPLMTWSDQFTHEIHRRIVGESIPRALKCLDMLSETEIWLRPNGVSNSVGNLVLHLCGNARQWILAAMTQQPYLRNRDAEFDEMGPLPTDALHAALLSLSEELSQAIGSFSPDQLTATYRVQGFDETGIGILVHVAEHFSYHVGQITWFVKAHTGQATGYYEGLDLNV